MTILLLHGHVFVDMFHITLYDSIVVACSYRPRPCMALMPPLVAECCQPSNAFGILLHGLLPPKIVVDEYGGSRTDAGMLGR
jgi:hypothetical protein